MVFLRGYFLIFVALVLGGGQIFAAGGAKEQHAYAAAMNAFQDGIYPRAETEFAQFLQKYPQSTNAPKAVLMQAQAQFKQGKFADSITLLDERKAKAGNLAGQYDYWIGEAQFANGDFSGAAETFASLSRNSIDSSVKLPAAVEAAAAYDKLGNYSAIVALLQETNSMFQHTAQLDPDNEMVSSGRLLLARAMSALNDLDASDFILASMNPQTLKLAQDWQRAYLLCQNKIAAGDLDAALSITTNLQKIAKNDNLRAKSVAMRAALLEKMNQFDAASDAYQENLTNAPPERQRQAILKIAELATVKNDRADAEAALEKFLAQFPDSSQSDIALLTLGELHLADYVAQPAAEHLQQASTAFDRFLAAFANSPLAGKAHLDRGWCNWFLFATFQRAGKISESLDDFKAAVQKLPASEEKTVARFKTGDALFAQKNFRDALKSYRAVLDAVANTPAVRSLVAPALYQILRANLELNDMAGASNALAQILENYSANELAQIGTLLLGEASPDPAHARELFQKFETQFPGSRLRPQTELAIARTYEQEANWSAAITRYENWLKNFPSGDLQSQARYALAWANFQAGNETNAFTFFTQFVTQFPANALAPQAQWWLADHFFRAGNFVGAETNYELIFQNTNTAWQDSPLVYPARIMAGRAAIGRFGYSDASRYFTDLITNSDCPRELNVQARFAYGSALMLMSPSDTNTLKANFSAATNVFAQIVQSYPTNEWGALAQGEIGDCDLQLGDFDSATNAYAQVFDTNSPANISARSRAQIGFGIALEKKAALAGTDDQTNLLQFALGNYLDVFDGNNLRDDEKQDVFWKRKAGLQAAPLIELLNDIKTEKSFYINLEIQLPQLADSIEKKIAALPPEKK
jgi:TolA-binding protein